MKGVAPRFFTSSTQALRIWSIAWMPRLPAVRATDVPGWIVSPIPG
jgi:hypothetical protein